MPIIFFVTDLPLANPLVQFGCFGDHSYALKSVQMLEKKIWEILMRLIVIWIKNINVKTLAEMFAEMRYL